MTDTKTVPCEPTDLEQIADALDQAAHLKATTIEAAIDTLAEVKTIAFTAAVALRALAAAPAHQPDRQGAGEPVAWRYRTAPHRAWHLTRNAIVAAFEEKDGNEVQPLYAAPPPPADTAMREAPIDLIYDLAKKGRDKAGCDGWRAQEMCREIADIIERATLSRRDAAEGRG